MAIRCQTCQGRGKTPDVAGRQWQTCPSCEGAGAVQPTPARVPRWYSVQVVVPASGSNNGNIQILQDADFEWVFTLSSQTSTSLNVTCTDGSTQRILTPTNNPSTGVIPISLFAGTAQLPFPLLEPYIIARSSTMQFEFTDTSGSQNTVTMVLQGFSLFPQDAPQQGSAGHITGGQ